ncbi:MAG: lipopolysaccharide biosynthesis protein [Geminicoccaceae bacterium]
MMLRHGLAYLAARGLPALLNFAALAIYTRLLAPEQFGVYAMVVAALGIAHTVFLSWLDLGLLRFLATYEARRGTFIGTILIAFSAMLALAGLASLPALWLIGDPLLGRLLPLCFLLFCVEGFAELHLRLANAQLAPAVYGRMAITRALTALAVGGALVLAGVGPEGILVGLAAGAVAAVVAPTRRELGPLLADWRRSATPVFDPAVLRHLFLYGAPLVITLGLDVVLAGADRFLLASVIGADAAGVYAVGYQLTAYTLGTLLVIVNLAGYPLAVKAFESGGLAAAEPHLRQNALLLWGLGLPAAGGMALLAPNITAVVTGSAFAADAALVMPVLVLAALLQRSRTYYFDLAFQLRAQVGWQALISAATVVLNIGLNLLLIPHFGILGAAWATVAACGLGLALSIAFGRRLLALPLIWGEAGRLCLATAAMLAAIWPFRELTGLLVLPLQVGLGILAYAAALWLLDVGGLRAGAGRLLQRQPLGHG